MVGTRYEGEGTICPPSVKERVFQVLAPIIRIDLSTLIWIEIDPTATSTIEDLKGNHHHMKLVIVCLIAGQTRYQNDVDSNDIDPMAALGQHATHPGMERRRHSKVASIWIKSRRREQVGLRGKCKKMVNLLRHSIRHSF